MCSSSRTKRDETPARDGSPDRVPGDDASDDESDNSRQQISVLVVEDHPALRESLAVFLEYYGYDVATASGYEQALAAAETLSPDVAVCDRQLNDAQNGIDVARAVQRRFGTRLVFVSGTSIARLRDETVDLEVLAYIKKPALPDQIEAAVRLAAGSPASGASG